MAIHLQKDPSNTTVDDVLSVLQTSLSGLTHKEANARHTTYGDNRLPAPPKRNVFFLFIKQFHSVLVYVLILATIISFLLGDIIDALVIMAVVILNAGIGFYHEHKAENEIAALSKMLVPKARVIRDGTVEEIPTYRLTIGDIILLEEGDRIPADGRVVYARNFSTVESSLTGESTAVEKDTEVLSIKASIADRSNMVWMGTFVAGGSAHVVVTAIGAQTAFGKIATSLGTIKKKRGHFEKQAARLIKQMGIFAILTAVIIFFVGSFIQSLPFTEMFIFSIASLVSIIPEGLPAVLTIILAIGAHRMAKKRAIIKTLAATETVGVVDTIITDKTGTLTQNIMMVEAISLSDQMKVTVTGEGWIPKGTFHVNDERIYPQEHPLLARLLRIITICNNAHIVATNTPDGSITYNIINEPTEAALIVVAEKAGYKQKELLEEEVVLDAPPFDQDRKFRTVLVEHNNQCFLYAVGAPEAIMSRSTTYHDGTKERTLTKTVRGALTKDIQELTDRALRTLAVGYRIMPAGTNTITSKDVEGLTLIGTIGMRDPLRPDVPEAVAKAHSAGIRVIMATGDHHRTARAIAREIGLLNGDSDRVYTQSELETMDEAAFLHAVETTSVFARVSPDMKLRIAEVLQKQGRLVAMTGDGVNDAPALKRADVGIAMGIIGTDVSREASAIILADDNFATIIDAVEEGRIIFDNVRKASTFLVSTNFAEGFTILTTIVAGLPLPLLPTQILWLNIVTDSFAGIPLAAEPSHTNKLTERPRSPKEHILSTATLPFVILMVLVMAIATIGVFHIFLPEGVDTARTAAFSIMAFSQLFNVLNLRSFSRSIFEIKFGSNKWILYGIGGALIGQFAVLYVPALQKLFHFTTLSLANILLILAMSSSVLILGELYKLVAKGEVRYRNSQSQR